MDEKQSAVCQPKENITFMKIHKTGSTTVQNILFRYADNHNLHVGLPKNKISFAYPQLFQKKFVLESPDGIYNILCHHMRFNSKVVTEMMPENTVYVTIIRDPVSHYESFFTYFDIGKGCRMRSSDPSSLQKFFADPMKCYKKTRHNSMLYDLGMTENNLYNDREIQSMIEFLDKKFSLVMMMEYIEESIILLKDLLCWDFNDMTFFTLNARKDKSIHKMDDVTRKAILEFNSGDVKLYEHFNRTFWGKVQMYGMERMKEDVEKLRQMNVKLTNNCLQSSQDIQHGEEFKVYNPPGVKMDNKVLKKDAENREDCERRVYPEKVWTSFLKKKQFPGQFS
ncbi:galactosylceramide sulfotransferase-like [Glandiceps talaboti]